MDMPLQKIAILSRGYGRTSKGFLLVENSSNAKEVGDEPLQLKKNLKEAYVAVDEKRAHGIERLLSLAPQIRTIILDDALQHRYVKNDLSILLTNYNSPFYSDYMLPAGRLREPRVGYKRAKLIIVTNTPPNISDADKKYIIKKIQPIRKQKIFFSSISYQDLVPVFTSDIPIPIISKRYSVVLVTGIANADSLHTYLEERAKEVTHISFADHHIFQQADITKVMQSFNGIINPEKIIVTTEKDAMRLQTGSFANDFKGAPVFYIPIQVKIHKEESLVDAIISNLTPLTFARMTNTSKQ